MDGTVVDIAVYAVIGALTFGMGLIVGYLSLRRYYGTRFLIVAQACSDADSLVPLVAELERES
jgi:hypothetical protein